MKLNTVKCGEPFKITKIETGSKIKLRLYQMGIRENTAVTVIKISKLSRNILLNAGGNLIGIRCSLAEKISGLIL